MRNSQRHTVRSDEGSQPVGGTGGAGGTTEADHGAVRSNSRAGGSGGRGSSGAGGLGVSGGAANVVGLGGASAQTSLNAPWRFGACGQAVDEMTAYIETYLSPLLATEYQQTSTSPSRNSHVAKRPIEASSSQSSTKQHFSVPVSYSSPLAPSSTLSMSMPPTNLSTVTNSSPSTSSRHATTTPFTIDRSPFSQHNPPSAAHRPISSDGVTSRSSSAQLPGTSKSYDKPKSLSVEGLHYPSLLELDAIPLEYLLNPTSSESLEVQLKDLRDFVSALTGTSKGDSAPATSNRTSKTRRKGSSSSASRTTAFRRSRSPLGFTLPALSTPLTDADTLDEVGSSARLTEVDIASDTLLFAVDAAAHNTPLTDAGTLDEVGSSARSTEVDIASDTLFFAVNAGDTAFVEKLLDGGMDVNLRCKAGITALHYAAAACRDDMVTLLLRRGAHLQAGGNIGETPLHHAAKYDHSGRMVTQLLAAGADVNCVDLRGCTPLHVAATVDNVEAADALLQNGANAEQEDNNGWTPKMLTMHPDILRLLAARS